MTRSEIYNFLEKFTSSPTYLKSRWKQNADDKIYLDAEYASRPLRMNEKIALYHLDKTLNELGSVLRLSIERSRQIKFKALVKMLYMKDYDIESFNKIINEIEAAAITS